MIYRQVAQTDNDTAFLNLIITKDERENDHIRNEGIMWALVWKK